MGFFSRRHVDTTPEQRYHAEINQPELNDDQLRRRAMAAGGRVDVGGDVAVIHVETPSPFGGTDFRSQRYLRNPDGTWTAG